MNLLFPVLRLLVSIFLAFAAGKLISKLKLPAILGWLIAGMVIGPHGLGLLNEAVLEAGWFDVTERILESVFGLMIGTELIWSQMKKAGPKILVTTFTESLGTFVVVSLVFGVLFACTGVPVYLAFVFGGIALATAPAPSLSVVRDLKTDGPVTRTLIPMAALDDLVGALVFFVVMGLVSAQVSAVGIPLPAVDAAGLPAGGAGGRDRRGGRAADAPLPQPGGRSHGDAVHAAPHGGAGLFHQQPAAHSGAEFHAHWHGLFHGFLQSD